MSAAETDKAAFPPDMVHQMNR